MDAMEYEYLIRRVYHCGRHGAKGADADIYRRLERAQAHLTSTHWNKTQEEKEHDYNTAFAEVRMFVKEAIREGIKQVQHRLTDKEAALLAAIQQEANKLGFYDKKRLDEIIEIVDEIFRKYGLEPK
jgi:hypothetical protein